MQFLEVAYIKNLFENEKFMKLLEYYPDDIGNLEDIKYDFRFLDVKKLLEISPKVTREK